MGKLKGKFWHSHGLVGDFYVLVRQAIYPQDGPQATDFIVWTKNLDALPPWVL